MSAVSTVLNHCAFDGLIETAPKFRRRKESEGRVIWYTKDEVERLSHLSIDVYQREDLRDIILFGAYTGMRQGEILKLRARDVDLVSDRINVGGVPSQVTKAKNWRAIPIHDRIRDIVNTRVSHSSRQDVRIFGEEWSTKEQLLRAFKKVNRLINKEDCYVFHTLRHSYATWLAEAGVPIRAIMALCGHKNVDTTLRYAGLLMRLSRTQWVPSRHDQWVLCYCSWVGNADYSASLIAGIHTDVAELVDALVLGSRMNPEH